MSREGTSCLYIDRVLYFSFVQPCQGFKLNNTNMVSFVILRHPVTTLVTAYIVSVLTKSPIVHNITLYQMDVVKCCFTLKIKSRYFGYYITESILNYCLNVDKALTFSIYSTTQTTTNGAGARAQFS